MSTIAQNDLYRLIGEANGRGEGVVVATVAHTRGSTPQRRGAKMLFFENGNTAGTVGGGCVEAEVWAEAREAMRSGEPALHHFSLTADESSEEDLLESLLGRCRILEDYPNENRCLLAGYFRLSQKVHCPLHAVCDYSK